MSHQNFWYPLKMTQNDRKLNNYYKIKNAYGNFI